MNKLNTFTLIDDGTLDTVILCDDCGYEQRFSGEGIERDAEGTITRIGWLALEDGFADHECGEYPTLAEPRWRSHH